MADCWSKKTIRTQWFSRRIKPAKVGVYEVHCTHTNMPLAYAYWNGEYWGVFAYCISVAKKLKNRRSYYFEVFWRDKIDYQLLKNKVDVI